MELTNDFLDRIYVNFSDEIVFVYPARESLLDPLSKIKPDRWTLDQAKEYTNHLKSKEVIV